MEPATQKAEQKAYPLQEGSPDALVLHCSDPRFQEAFRQFIKDLGVQRPAPIAIPGSCASFGTNAFTPKNWYTLKNQIELLAEHNSFPRVILINHDDCKGYEAVSKWLRGLVSIEQRKHLKMLAEFLRKNYLPNSRLELYQARIVDGLDGKRTVQFEQII